MGKHVEYGTRNTSFASTVCSEEKERKMVRECGRTVCRYRSLTKRFKSRFN
jgi:hypothetical protein